MMYFPQAIISCPDVIFPTLPSPLQGEESCGNTCSSFQVWRKDLNWISAFVGMILLILSVSLTACGFTPLYAERTTDTSITQSLNDITITPIPDRDGQALRNALIDRLYRNGAPHHAALTLVIQPLSEAKTDLDVTANDEATRRQLRLSTTLILKDPARADPLLTRSLYSIVSYNVLESQFTTRVTEQTARDNAVVDLARQIEQALVIYFKTPALPLSQRERVKRHNQF